ncbi:MAG TPA: HDOD domain-containing protein [Candidatus Sulfotelmatobacter sp.]|nr:HDOD domain-containing protein [Candidatus Sulfotelmatobacter sp.]
MTAIALVQNVKNLPPVSQAALKLIGLLDRSSTDNNDVVQVLKHDTVLTAKLLKACNAPSFGLGETVSSVDHAVFMLGHEQILHTVLTLAFSSVMAAPTQAFTAGANELWQHSLIAAAAADTVFNHLPGLNAQPTVAFTAALLHDIGKLVFAQTLLPEELADIRDRAERKLISGTDAEREVLGIDHGETGAALLQSWRLPASIVEAVANHHRPFLKPEPRLSVLVHIANAVAHHSDAVPGQSSHDLKIDVAVCKDLDINPKKLEAMVADARQSFKRVNRFMAMS